jgi:hypothetical protein
MSRETVEFRGDVPRDLAEAFDMIALAKGMARNTLFVRVIRLYVVQKQHEANLVARSAPVTPPAPDSEWSRAE